MTTTDHAFTGPRAPIVTLGPCGRSILFVDDTTDAALAHLSADHEVDVTNPAASVSEQTTMSDLAFYDSSGRRLRTTTVEGMTTLVVVDDDDDHRDEICARVDETFAHVRARAYGDHTLLNGAPVKIQAWEITPPDAPRQSAEQPTDAAYERYFWQLHEQLSSSPADHLGSWWHNLFHR